jgi:hypothetical protein
MDPIKDAFSKVKQDMDLLKVEIDTLKQTIEELTRTIQQIPQDQQTNISITPTHNLIELSKQSLYGLESPKSEVSIGNEGVPTNQQTNKPTNQRIGNEGVPSKVQHINQLERAHEILTSLDELKKEVRIKFKRLTEQEMLIFTIIYSSQEQGFIVDYPLIASKTGLSEISIRDYVRKIILKGIPLEKLKINNKKIALQVSAQLKQIASIDTLQTLRKI